MPQSNNNHSNKLLLLLQLFSNEIVNEKQFNSVTFPVIGAGSGGFNTEKALNIMIDEFKKLSSNADVIIIIYRK